ncbi:MAG TPA: protein-L-isoaspartate O-methyltransferase [Polyangiaceae bacterium]
MARARSPDETRVPSPDTADDRRPRSRTSPRKTDPGRRKVEAREALLSKALEEVPRHLFFPVGIDREIANHEPIPLGRGRVIPPVDVVAMMLRALELDGTERVLEIGGGSGYQAALLGRLARDVVSIDVDGELVKQEGSLFDGLGCPNVRLVHADAYAGWPEAGPYQAIVVSAAVPEVPSSLIDQLDFAGRLVIPLGDAEAQLVERLRKRVDGLDSQTIGPCRLHMLTTPRKTPASFPWTGQHGKQSEKNSA